VSKGVRSQGMLRKPKVAMIVPTRRRVQTLGVGKGGGKASTKDLEKKEEEEVSDILSLKETTVWGDLRKNGQANGITYTKGPAIENRGARKQFPAQRLLGSGSRGNADSVGRIIFNTRGREGSNYRGNEKKRVVEEEARSKKGGGAEESPSHVRTHQ